MKISERQHIDELIKAFCNGEITQEELEKKIQIYKVDNILEYYKKIILKEK